MKHGRASASDPPFHFEIWRGPEPSFGQDPKAIYYVENHNGQCGYGELATDFETAARELIAAYRSSGLGNWVAPLAHLTRQTLELCLKALTVSIRERDESVSGRPLRSHDLGALWSLNLGWLDREGFAAGDDARRLAAMHLIEAYQAIDPSGDLFRFGISYKHAFGKQKSYDRVGIVLDQFELGFDSAVGFLNHWEAVVRRRTWGEQEGWTEDPIFDAEAFPRLSGNGEAGS
ncbi:MAG TPA: hypothetical protein VF650_02600 [Allosphingosinicella sp.]